MVCACLGVLVILKRVVFIGVTLAESAALGVALSLSLGLPPLLGASLLSLAVVGLLSLPFQSARLPRETLLGVIFVTASSLAVLVVAGSGFGLHEVKTLLYGDLILTGPGDLALVAAVLLPLAGLLLLFRRPLFYTFLDREAARVLGIRVRAWELLFFACLGLAISASARSAGSLLVFCYLVAPSSLGLLLSRSMGWAMLAAGASAVLGTLGGLALSLAVDLPANQTVAAVLAGLLAGAALARLLSGLRRPRGKQTDQWKSGPGRPTHNARA